MSGLEIANMLIIALFFTAFVNLAFNIILMLEVQKIKKDQNSPYYGPELKDDEEE